MKRGIFLVTLSGALFGTMGYLGTQILGLHFSIENMLFWRFAIAAVLCLLFTMKGAIKLPFKALIKTLLIASVCYSGCTAAYFLASRYIGTGLAMVLFFSFPIFVALLSWTFGRVKVSLLAVGALTAVIIGLVCLHGGNRQNIAWQGISLGVLSALFYAVYLHNSHNNARHMDAKLLTLLVCVGNAFLFGSYSCVADSFQLPTSWQAWSYIVALATVATVIPIWLLLKGLKEVSAIQGAILSVMEPIITLLIGVMILKESVGPLQMVGVAIILASAVAIQFDKKRVRNINKNTIIIE